MISQKQSEALREQLHGMHRARMLASLDHHRGREGPGAHLHAALSAHRGGNLPVMGRGIDTPSFNLYDAHLGGLLPVIGDGLPVMGGGLHAVGGAFGWLKKLVHRVGSLGKKAVAKVADHAKAALEENKGRLMEIGKSAADHVMNTEGSIADRLRGGVSKAVQDTHQLAREQAASRIRGLIA